MKYTQIPTTTFQNIQLNAGVLVDDFNPVTGVIGKIIGATSGGVNFKDTIEYKDFGEDVDNCPKNMLEFKKLDKHDVKMSGTFVTISVETAKLLSSAADIDSDNSSHIIPRNDILTTDFKTIWWIGDYSDDNTGDNAGYVAIKLMNALNTGGFQIQSTDKDKGKFAFEFTGHYSIFSQDVVPYEIYVKQGGVAIVSIEPEADDATFPWTSYTPGEFQSNIAISDDNEITGTLNFISGGLADSGPLAGDGNFLAIKFVADDWNQFTSVKVGLEPSSSGMGLVEILDDPDKNGVFKISNNEQVFKVVATDGDDSHTTTYSLENLILETE